MYGIRLKNTNKYLFQIHTQYRDASYGLQFGFIDGPNPFLNFLYVWRDKTGANLAARFIEEHFECCPKIEVINLKEVFDND